jgi:hypothetical protein
MAVLGLILGMFWAVSYALSIHHRRHAGRLLRQLATVQPGATGFRTVQQIAQDFGGKKQCAGDLCSFVFDDRFMFMDSGPPRVLRTEWDYLGLRPWRVTAVINQRNSEPTDLEITALIGRGRGGLYHEGLFSGNMWAWRMVSVSINSERFEYRLKGEKENDPEYAIEAGSDGIIVVKPNFDIPGGGEALNVYLSPAAPSASKRVAFDLNLRCATAMSACTDLCQLAPSAWHINAHHIMKSNGWSIVEPKDCAAANHQ